YIDDAAVLHRQDAGGREETIARDVAEAAVAPNGLRLAFINRTTNLNEVWAYDVGLRARYELALDTAPVSAVSWPPAGNRIAFLSSNQVWLMNADGTRPTALTKEDPASFPYSCRAVAWTRI